MSTRSNLLPPPSDAEEVRLLAAAFADLHAVVALVVERRQEFLPGEASEEIANAWTEANESFLDLVKKLVQASTMHAAVKVPKVAEPFTPEGLHQHQLIGPVGTAKRSLMLRLKDRFFSHSNSFPQSDERRAQAAHAAVDLFECAASIAGSIGGTLGGVVEEFLLLLKQGISLRLRRGH